MKACRVFFKKLSILILLVLSFPMGSFAIPTGTGGHEFPLGSDADDDFVVDTNSLVVEGDTGNVGIGTDSPDADLDVEGAENTELIRLTDSTNVDSAGVFVGSGTPESAVTAQLGSLYLDHNGGDVYAKSSGDGTNTGWAEVATTAAGAIAKTGYASSSSTSTNNTTTYSDYLTLNFTPSSASSTIVISATLQHSIGQSSAVTIGQSQLLRDAVVLVGPKSLGGSDAALGSSNNGSNVFFYQEASPGTSEVSYKLQFRRNSGNATNQAVAAEIFVMEFTTSGADLAEVYFTNSKQPLEPGSLVSLDPVRVGAVQATRRAYDPLAFGIVSTKPWAIMMDDDIENKGTPVYVALVGRVPVRVNLENGAIQPGDFLTPSSTPGIAMKATKSGAPTIAQALGGWNHSDSTGRVIAVIKNGVLPTSIFQPEIKDE